MNQDSALHTPDGRYIVVRGRLWRATNPSLDPQHRQQLVDQLMEARPAVAAVLRSDHADELKVARQRVDEAKCGLGERGPVWWTDGEPDLNRHMVRTTLYADSYTSVQSTH